MPSTPRFSLKWLLLSLLLTSRLLAEDGASSPLPPEEAARTMKVPEGFQVTLFAGEPDVQQPVGFCIDDRGRLWVAEAYSYPVLTNKPGKDRILIFEDTDGDGRFDRRTVFYEGLNYVTGIEVGFGGVWVVSPPYFYFIPDQDGDDKPDSEPVVLLDGFGNHANSHNLANALAWGPDGWLYGTHGRTNWSMIGPPGAPESERIRFDGGVYRYHPVTHIWEPFADGTTNPWSLDWDDHGQAFVCNCVDPHLYHVIQGAHYEPWRNRDSSRYAYERIATIADHRHYVGKATAVEAIGTPEEDAAGGGHAHCGTLVYLGDNWPEQYRNTIFMNNIHGHRINQDIPRRVGSGYVASHGKDLMRAADSWYMGVTLQTGPDGAVFASDWSDTGECHSLKNTQRQTGRIFKISYGQPTFKPVNLAQLSDKELGDLQFHRNDWYVRHARRILQERHAQNRDQTELVAELRSDFDKKLPVDRKLRLLWTLFVLDAADDDFLLSLLKDESEYIRAWAVRLLTGEQLARLPAPTNPTSPPLSKQPSKQSAILERLTQLAKQDPSPFVLLHLASALQATRATDRWPLAEALVARKDFIEDANLPLMIWYGIEPLIQVDQARFISLSFQAESPLVRRHIARRSAEWSLTSMQTLNLLVKQINCVPSVAQRDLLEGVLQGLEGTRRITPPGLWSETYSRLQASTDATVRDLSLRLALVFDDPLAVAALKKQIRDPATPVPQRTRAIEAMLGKKSIGLDQLLLELLRTTANVTNADDRSTLQSAALRGLAAYNHVDTSDTVLSMYSSLAPNVRVDAVQTLASRKMWAGPLLKAVETGKVPRSELSAFTARQLRSLNDAKLTAQLEKVWGKTRDTAADKIQLIAQHKKRLTPDVLKKSDRAVGRAIFDKSCGNCHRLFDAGGNIGPNLTGAQRTNLDYLLENLVDPSAIISKDYQMTVIETQGGRLVTGLIISESEVSVKLQTPTESVILPVEEISQRSLSKVSMMPDGLLQNMSPTQLDDLMAYLMGDGQVAPKKPLPEK